MIKHIVWSNRNLDINDWRDDLCAEYGDNLSEDELIRHMYEANDTFLEDERMNLDIQLPEEIVVIGDLGLWNGRACGYKIIKSGNIKDCLYSDNDHSEWYVDGRGNLQCTSSHHDGTNYYTYRVFKEGLSDTQKENFLDKIYCGTVTSQDISRYTRSVGKEICKVYGW